MPMKTKVHSDLALAVVEFDVVENQGGLTEESWAYYPDDLSRLLSTLRKERRVDPIYLDIAEKLVADRVEADRRGFVA